MLICILCAIMGDIRSVIVVGGMIFLSVFLSYFQEKRLDAAVQSLKKMIRSTVITIREGSSVQINLEDIVPGDIMVLLARLGLFRRPFAF